MLFRDKITGDLILFSHDIQVYQTKLLTHRFCAFFMQTCGCILKDTGNIICPLNDYCIEWPLFKTKNGDICHLKI